MTIASLGMYDFPWLREETDALWAAIRARLPNGPDSLDRTRDLRAIWHDPALLLAQTCGYPLVTELSGAVRVIGTPVYDFPGCAGPDHCSFIVVRADDLALDLPAMRGRVAAINGYDSNSGMNLFRASVAPFARGANFFDRVVVTDAHLNSLAAVRDGTTDIAAIDCVTYGLTARYRPDLLSGIRVLMRTEASPALPFVTHAAASDDDIATLRAALAAVLPWTALGLIAVAPAADYERVTALSRQAASQGYPALN